MIQGETTLQRACDLHLERVLHRSWSERVIWRFRNAAELRAEFGVDRVLCARHAVARCHRMALVDASWLREPPRFKAANLDFQRVGGCDCGRRLAAILCFASSMTFGYNG